MSKITRGLILGLALTATSAAGPASSRDVSIRVELPGPATRVLVTDTDSDGALDLVVAPASGARLVVARGDGAGGFAAPVALPDLAEAGASHLLDLAAADIDGDGDLDLIGAGAPPTLWLAEGGGAYLPFTVADRPASHVAVADLDADGDPDVVLVTAAGLATLRNDGGGLLTAVGTSPLGAAWPVRSLHVADDGSGAPILLVHGGPTDATIAWSGAPDATLVETPSSSADEPSAPGDVLAQADFDGDGKLDQVSAAPDRAAALIVTLRDHAQPVASQALSLRSGRLRRVGRGDGVRVRALVRARLPGAADAEGLRPLRLTLGDAAAPAVLELAPDGWTTESADVDVWRGAPGGSHVGVIVDRRAGFLTVSATGLRLPVAPEEAVEVSVEWVSLRAVHRSGWVRRHADLVYPPEGALHTPQTSDVSPLDALLRPGERIDGDFVALSKTIDGRKITLLRRRSTGETWRLDPGGAWTLVDATGHRTARASKANRRAKTQLHFAGPVDGSDEIRIDAAGATWWSRHWGLPQGSAKLNGVYWRPRDGTTLPNAGETRFLPAGVRFATGRLVKADGRDLIALETAADHVTLKVSDSPNGPGDYDVVIEFEND